MTKTCNACKNEKIENIGEMTTVTMSSADWQRNEQRHERREKRLLVALIAAISLLFVSNAIWIYAWMQYDYSSTTEEINIDAEQDGNGVNIIGGGNVDYVAESKNNDSQENENED